jgi:hypothetical protein
MSKFATLPESSNECRGWRAKAVVRKQQAHRPIGCSQLLQHNRPSATEIHVRSHVSIQGKSGLVLLKEFFSV